MEIHNTLQHQLVYAAMGAYLLAFLLSVIKQQKAGWLLYTAGFLLALAAFIYRWIHTQHVPFQNMFEVCLSMGMMVLPLTLFCRRFFGIQGQAADMLIGLILLFPVGFVFSHEPRQLPPALQCWLFIPHVAVYLMSYVIMAKAAVQAGACLIATDRTVQLDTETQAYRMVCLGFPLLTLGLLLGSWWGKLAWGDYWGWDPKELWSLVSWLVYVGYFHYRYMSGTKHPKLCSLWVLFGMTAVLITLLWVNLSRIFPGLHNYAT
ncbi:MAG: cytochrome c biogenesis protein CcsA [Planctomycetota bacterium]|jgi:ABC-type transport system involved in cytochrome c biogenesis permease subunit